MRKNARKIVTVLCNVCKKEVVKLKKEYDRQIRNGKTNFYCNNKCSWKDNAPAQKLCQYSVDHPKEAYEKLKSYPNENFRSKDEYSPFRRYLSKIKNRIKDFTDRKDCDISIEYLKTLWEKQNGVCPYTGIQMELKALNNQLVSPYNASVDRIDSSKGYTKDNVEFVCLFINYGKNGFSKEQVQGFLSKIIK